ncbi:MAG: ABC transporter ATP-binding protein [Pseudomonadota bacterium]
MSASATTPAAQDPLVAVSDLRVAFTSQDGTVNAVNGVDFTLDRGEVLCILGESGSGKSVTMRALMKLLPEKKTTISGNIRLDHHDIVALSDDAMSDLRGPTVSMIFQEPMTAFDPVFTVGDQIVETIRRHEAISDADARKRALDLLELVQIPSAARRLKNYPFELSGGMRQRAMIALALACNPSLLLADEPTTALDATVQIQILLLLRKLQRELGMAVVFVTHDIGVAIEIGDRIAVMYAGRFVETGPVRDVFANPAHPYTRGLMASTVKGSMRGQRLQAIDGSPPDLSRLPPGCAFAPRCGLVQPVCLTQYPATAVVTPGHVAACIHAGKPLVGTSTAPPDREGVA